MALVRLCAQDGTWGHLKAGWAQQCDGVGEEFGLYAQGTFLVLDQLAQKPERKAGIYAVQRGDEVPDVICQVNTTPLPGHPEPVLRVRMVTVCPEIDFGNAPKERYIQTLADLFVGILELSDHHEMGAKEFKMHLRSPEDYNFFRVVQAALSKWSRFQEVNVYGAWLHILKA